VPVSQQSDSLSDPSKSQNGQLDTSHEGSSTPSITIKISEMPLIARYVAHALAIFMQPYYMHGVVLLCITHPRHPRLCMQLLLTIFFWFQSSPHHDSAYQQPPSLYLSKSFPISSYRSRNYIDYHIISHYFSSSHILSVSFKYLQPQADTRILPSSTIQTAVSLLLPWSTFISVSSFLLCSSHRYSIQVFRVFAHERI
jgi:hypothetical protein